MKDRIPRPPCQSCGGRLYYHEQWQDFCGKCAQDRGIKRICDRPDARFTTRAADYP